MVNNATGTLIALGSNLSSGDLSSAQVLSNAIGQLDAGRGKVRAVSKFYATPCFPAGAGPDYVNAVVILDTGHNPDDLLTHLHEVEATLGRERTQRWGQRTLDLDLLAHGDLVLPDTATYGAWAELPGEDQKIRAPEQLILPHPRLHERAFVLVPLCDVAPDWIHPVLHRSARELLADLPANEVHAIRPL